MIFSLITNWCYAYNGVVSFFKQSVQGLLVQCFTKSFVKKHSFWWSDSPQRKVKPTLLVKTEITCKIFKQKHFPRNNCSKIFRKFWINTIGRVHLQKVGEVFNFTKDRLWNLENLQNRYFLYTCSQLLPLLCNAMVFFIKRKGL